MANDLNGIINDHDYRLRMLEGKPLASGVVDRLIPAGGADGEVLTKTSATDYAVAWEAPRSGYIYSQTVYYTASGTFSKASYAGIKAVRVRVAGAGGGGGGGATTGANQWASGGGGGGGAYTEKFIVAASLGASETVTVGSAGAAGSAGANSGSTGGSSSFGAHCAASGGSGGTGAAVSTSVFGDAAGAGGTVTTAGDLNIPGQRGSVGFTIPNSVPNYFNAAIGSGGGDSLLGTGGVARSTTSALTGYPGGDYGGGGGGGIVTESSTQQAGGAGADGIVIVDIFI